MRRGQSLVEVLIGIAVGVLFIIGAIGAIVPSLTTKKQVVFVQTQAAAAKEFTDNIRSWAAGNWNSVLALATSSANPYYLFTAQSPFTAWPGEELVFVGGIAVQRYFYVSDVYRDTNGNVTTTVAGNSYDPSTKQVNIVVDVGAYGATVGTAATTTPNSFTEWTPAVAYKGRIYLLGIFQAGGGTQSDTVNYANVNADGSLGSWTQGTNFSPGTILYDQGGALYNGYLYVLGGHVGVSGSTYTSTVFYAPINADGSVGSWTKTTPLPVAGSGQPIQAFAYNGYLYALNATSSNLNSDYYAPINADGSVGNWTTTTAESAAPNDTAVFSSNGYVYSVTLSYVYYAPINAGGSLGSWVTSTHPSPNSHTAAVTYDGSLYIMGGSSPSTSSIYTANINADGSLGSWSLGGNLFAPIYSVTAVAWNGRLYTLGFVPSGPTTTVATAGVLSTSTKSFSTSFYLTRNQNSIFSQTNWSGGSGQNAPVTFVSNTYATSTNINTGTANQITLTAASGYSASGTLDSATFDTGISSGAQLDSFVWQGSASNGTAAQFQFAVSNSSSGPWNFWGPDGTSNTYFTGNPNTLIGLVTSAPSYGGWGLFSGYRYFRYRVKLVSDSNHLYTPTVNQVTVNWSP